MNRCKKIAILVCAFLTALNVVACGEAKGDEVVYIDEFPTRQQDSSLQTVEGTELEIKEDETANADESSVNQQESSMQIEESTNLETEEDKTIGAEKSNAQTGENISTEMTTEELLDLFINGSISAISSGDSAFYITDLDMDSGEWDSYSIGERVDLDNDGENELIICGPYGAYTLMRAITRSMNLPWERVMLLCFLMLFIMAPHGLCTATECIQDMKPTIWKNLKGQII